MFASTNPNVDAATTPGTARAAKIKDSNAQQLAALRRRCANLSNALADKDKELNVAGARIATLEGEVLKARRTARTHMDNMNNAVKAKKEVERTLANAESLHAAALSKTAAARDEAKASNTKVTGELKAAEREVQNMKAQLARAMARVPAIRCSVCAEPLPKEVELASVCEACCAAMG